MTDLLTTQWGADKVAASIGSRLLLYAPNRIDVLTAAVTSLNFDDPTALLGGTAGAVLGGAPGAVAGYTAVLGTELRNALAASVPAYLDSEREGVTELWAQFKFTRLNCPTTKIVLAGYSQGAMVVHDFLNQLAGTRDSAGQASIIGAVLLGDPDRVKHADVLEFGPVSYASYGVCHVPELVSLSGCSSNSRVQDVSPMFQARTVSVCNYDDPVCDTSDFFPDLAGHFLHDGSNRYFCASCARDFAGTAFTTIHGSYSHIEPAALAGKLMGRYVLAKV